VEVFSVLQGTLAFQYLGEPPFLVSAGNSETVASGRSHTFWNTGTQALHILLACSPSGLDEFFEDIHREMQRVRAGELQQSDVGACMEKLPVRHGIEESAPAPDIA